MNPNRLFLGARGKTSRPEFSKVLRRTRLFELFDRALEHPILWIASPGGAGKTVAVSSYLAEKQGLVLWYSIDKRDDDPAHFFLSLGTAAGHFQHSENLPPLPALTPEYIPSLEIFSRNFFEELFNRLPKPGVLVLDNYQEASDTAALHDALRCAGELVPPGLNLIIISREVPPLAFARMQTHGDLSVIGWEQIKLNMEEAQGLADLRRGEAVNADLVRDCYDRAQGWAAGVVLLLDYNANDNADKNVLNHFKPDLLFNYFISEIFGHLPEVTQTVLMQIALLPKITALLAERLSQNQNVSHILADLQQHSFFIAQRPDQEASYEFHPLFHEFLILRANQVLGAAEIIKLQRKAAEILCDIGLQEDAVPLFIKGQDWLALSKTIQMLGQTLLMQGRHQTLAQWLNDVPAEVIEQDAWLLYYLGSGQLPSIPESARQNFTLAFSLFEKQDEVSGLYLSWCAVVDTYLIAWTDFSGLCTWVVIYSKLNKRHPVFPTAEIEIRVHIMLLALLHSQPQHEDLPVWAESAYQLVVSEDHGLQGVQLACALLLYFFWTGDFNRFLLILNITKTRMKFYPKIPIIYQIVLVNQIMFQWSVGNAKDSLRLTFEGFEYSDQNGMHLWDYLLGSQGILAALSAGEPVQAQRIFDRSRAYLQIERDIDSSAYHFSAGLIKAQYREWIPAKEHFRFCMSYAQTANALFIVTFGRAMLVHALFELGENQEAEKELRIAYQSANLINSQLAKCILLMTEARKELKNGKHSEGFNILSQGLALCRECGGLAAGAYWGPAFMTEIYTAALEAEIEVPFVQEMIRRLDLSPSNPSTAPDAWPWPIRIHTLGQFKITVNGKVLSWSGKTQRKPLELLKALISFGGHAVAEEKLCEAVWPDADGDSAHRDFSTALYRLRRLLGNEKALRIEHSRLSLEPKLVWLDSECFEARLQPITFSSSLTTKQQDSLTSAMVLYQGVFLPDENAPWILATRNRLHNKFHNAVETMGKCFEDESKYPDAEAWYQKILEIDPFNETVYLRLMQGYERLGQLTKALAIYEQCRQLFASQLKRQPSAELQALHRRLTDSVKMTIHTLSN